jgi:3-hydroxyisobutyrate dehydrogenase
MGRPMALNLVKHGFSLVVHDIDPAKVEPLRERGAKVEGSAERVAAATERTICIVETTAQAESVIVGDDGIVKGARPGHIVVCMSTIDPFVARRMAEALATRGIAMVDAPVSGGTTRAASGELSIIVGGAPETFAACRDLFEAMGTKIFHVGGHGQGLAMKLLNNMLVHVNRVAVAEALVMGVKAGLDPQMIYDVVRVSTGSSVAFESAVPRILARDFSPGGTVDISFKDQELETGFAKRLGVPVLLASVSHQVYQMARAAGLNKEDGSAIIKVFEKLAGLEVSVGRAAERTGAGVPGVRGERFDSRAAERTGAGAPASEASTQKPKT